MHEASSDSPLVPSSSVTALNPGAPGNDTGAEQIPLDYVLGLVVAVGLVTVGLVCGALLARFVPRITPLPLQEQLLSSAGLRISLIE